MHDNVFETPPYIICVDFLGIIQKNEPRTTYNFMIKYFMRSWEKK